MKTTVKFGATVLFAVTVLFGSCKKKTVAEEDTDLEVSGNNTQMESEEMQYRDEEAGATADCNFDWSAVTGCATITQSSLDFPKVVTVDYGTVGCTDNKGRLKKGKIIFTMSDNIRNAGAVRDITFDGFSVNGKTITGERHAENIGVNAAGNFEIRVTGSITAVNANGKVHSRTFDRVREWTAGYATCTHSDDEYSITGSGTCTNNSGNVKNWIITSPLIVKPGICNYIMSGVINFGPSDKGAIIDFGNGSCDNLATLTNKKNGVVRTLNLDTHKIQ